MTLKIAYGPDHCTLSKFGAVGFFENPPLRPHGTADDPHSDDDGTKNKAFQSLAEIGASQLKVAEMVVNMLSNSLNKIAAGSKPDKQG